MLEQKRKCTFRRCSGEEKEEVERGKKISLNGRFMTMNVHQIPKHCTILRSTLEEKFGNLESYLGNFCFVFCCKICA